MSNIQCCITKQKKVKITDQGSLTIYAQFSKYYLKCLIVELSEKKHVRYFGQPLSFNPCCWSVPERTFIVFRTSTLHKCYYKHLAVITSHKGYLVGFKKDQCKA